MKVVSMNKYNESYLRFHVYVKTEEYYKLSTIPLLAHRAHSFHLESKHTSILSNVRVAYLAKIWNTVTSPYRVLLKRGTENGTEWKTE